MSTERERIAETLEKMRYVSIRPQPDTRDGYLWEADRILAAIQEGDSAYICSDCGAAHDGEGCPNNCPSAPDSGEPKPMTPREAGEAWEMEHGPPTAGDMPHKVEGESAERIGKWSDNVPVAQIGRAWRVVRDEKAGDDIDRGLAVIAALKDLGLIIHRDR